MVPSSSIVGTRDSPHNDHVLDADLRKRVGKRLRDLRKTADLSQAAIAKRADISIGTVQTIERGLRQSYDSNIAAYARVFGTSIAALKRKDAIPPNDPLLKDLNREDFEIARAYHEASSMVRHQARQLLRDRDPQEPTEPLSDVAAAREARIAKLTPERQQLVDDLIAELEPVDDRDRSTG